MFGTTQIAVNVGEVLASQNSGSPLRQGKTSELITSDAHGRYHEATSNNKKFSGAITGQVTTVGVATTYTGLCLSNPINSLVNLSITNVGYAFTVAFAAVSVIGLATGVHTSTNVVHTAAVTPRSQKFTGAGGAVGLLDSSATLPAAPTLNRILNAATTATAAVPPLVFGNHDIGGEILLTPGTFCILYTSAASGAAGGSFNLDWEEIAII